MNNDETNPVSESINHLFRHKSGQMVSVLARYFGLEKLDLIEDAIQDAMIRAMKVWSIQGIPQNPGGWLIEVAKNRLLDYLRREKRNAGSVDELENSIVTVEELNPASFANEINEDELQMMFACCHPHLTPDSQVALTLKTVGGFSVGEIASAFLSSEDSVAKMVTRAKQKLRQKNVRLEMPTPEKIDSRLEAVLKAVYLIFTEGYNAANHELLVRKDLCFEAIRLAGFLANHPLTNQPKVHAMLALFMFQASRLPARFDDQNDIVILEAQDRSLWDKRLIAAGLRHFRASAKGSEMSDYHIESQLALVHSLAPDYKSTDWGQIFKCYEMLAARRSSPVIELNKNIALAKLTDAATGLEVLEKLRADFDVENYPLYFITVGELQAEAGRGAEAVKSLETAEKLTTNKSVLRFLAKKKEAARASGTKG